MGHRDDRIQKLERVLGEAFRSLPDPPVGSVDVTQRVMRAIRQSADEDGRWLPSIVLDQLIWRTATIAAGVVLLVTVFAVSVSRTAPGEMSGLLAEDFDSAPLYGDY